MSSDPMVPLRGGPAVPLSVVQWLLGAEDRGLHVRLLPDGGLHVGPRDRVREDDLTYLRAHRALVAACVSYCDRIAAS